MAGYIDARPHRQDRGNLLHRTAGPYIRVKAIKLPHRQFLHSAAGAVALSWTLWYGLFAPKGAPSDIIGKLNDAAAEALADPAVRSRLVDLGMDIFPRDQQAPESLNALLTADAKKWCRS
jgi:hypothetical protein